MKTKLILISVISMFALVMLMCSEEESPKKEMQEVDLTYLENYQFMGEPPAVIQKKAGKTVTRTIKFLPMEGTFEFTEGVEGCAPAPYLTLTGSGNASHIGKYTVINEGCYDGVSPILGIITAANGDEIHTYVASAVQDPNTGIWDYHYVIYGGTGRFLGAVGDIYMVATIDFVNLTYQIEGEGPIEY